jgi:phage terminase large subunit-like protein
MRAEALQWLYFAAAKTSRTPKSSWRRGVLHGAPDASKLEEAAGWLEQAAAQGNQNGQL